jgi:hypothetical protein
MGWKRLAIDRGAVGAAQIREVAFCVRTFDLGMLAGDERMGQDQVTTLFPANNALASRDIELPYGLVRPMYDKVKLVF